MRFDAPEPTQEQEQPEDPDQETPGFDEVPDRHMFDTEIAWLASTGITQGRADGTYGLNDPVTRGAMAAFHAAAVWISADGLSWQRIVHDDAVFGVGRQSMSSVTTGGPGLVAVGFDLNRDAAAGWTRP